jgi:hypothetical protein
MTIDFDTALNTYFAFKNKYEDKYNSRRALILNDEKLKFNRKKRRQQLRAIKMPCISCKRLVGTIFQDKDRLYSAVCGSKSDPCKLNIQIRKSNTQVLDAAIELTQRKIDEVKFDIIKTKLALLFGYIDEDNLISIYEGLNDTYQDYSKELNLLESEYQKNVNLEERKKNVRDLNIENYEAVKEIKAMMSEYLATENQSILKDVIEKYMDVIVENNDLLRENRYHMTVIEPAYEAKTGLERELIQKWKTIQDNEISIDSPEVLAFIV